MLVQFKHGLTSGPFTRWSLEESGSMDSKDDVLSGVVIVLCGFGNCVSNVAHFCDLWRSDAHTFLPHPVTPGLAFVLAFFQLGHVHRGKRERSSTI